MADKTRTDMDANTREAVTELMHAMLYLVGALDGHTLAPKCSIDLCQKMERVSEALNRSKDDGPART